MIKTLQNLQVSILRSEVSIQGHYKNSIFCIKSNTFSQNP